jgi:aconitate decarboxylase|uniref:MmgE/PrpD family protein n=1 Tax=Orrella sp. TaxID=1921583 RepID=UPI0040486F82
MQNSGAVELKLAEHAAGLTFESLPSAAVDQAQIFVADTLSVGVAGSRVAELEPLIRAVKGWGTQISVGVWGQNFCVDPSQAVLLNAFQVHCQEFDCLHEGAVLHAMATLLPVLTAQAQISARPISGRQFLTAIAAGVDVACTLGLAANQGLRFFRPATAGGFGAVAGLANLRGFDAQQTRSAFGHQLAQVSGTMQGHTEGSAVLPLQVGLNARAAWQSCDLTAAGFPSLTNPITGQFGYLPLFEVDFDMGSLLDELGQIWRVEQLSHKPFPSGRACHGGVEGLMALRREHGFAVEQVKRITVAGPPLINHLVNRPPIQNPLPNYARLCMPYVLAKVLQHGEIEPTHYDQDALEDPVTFALSQKVTMVSDGNPDPNTFAPQTVTVELTSGECLVKVLNEVLASPARRLDKQARDKKFRACWALANTALEPPDTVMAQLEQLQTLEDVRPLLARLTSNNISGESNATKR